MIRMASHNRLLSLGSWIADAVTVLSSRMTVPSSSFSCRALAEATDDPAARASLLTFLIVGAGPTGVELAGAIAELARNGMAKDFRNFDPASARILLVQAGGRGCLNSTSGCQPSPGLRLRRSASRCAWTAGSKASTLRAWW